MKVQIQRSIDRHVGPWLCRVASLIAKVTREKSPKMPQAPKNILVILLSEMGSVVLAGPMFGQIRSIYPNTNIHLLQLKKNQEVACLLRLVDSKLMYGISDKSGMRLIWDSVRIIFKLRKLRIDAVIDCELFSRVSSLLAFATGAPIISGFTPHTQEGLYRGSYITRPIPYNPYQHISKQFLALVDVLTSRNVSPRLKDTPIRSMPSQSGLTVLFEKEELKGYTNRLQREFPILAGGRQLVLLNAGGGILPERAWAMESYAQLARKLCDKGHAVAITGLKEDTKLAEEITLRCNSSLCINLTGYTKNLRELLKLMHAAHLLISNDGGPGHFATLTPIQSLVFFGPKTGRLYAPLGTRAMILESNYPCSPCLTAYNHRNTYCDGDNQCLKIIAVDTVLDLALAILKEERVTMLS